MLIGNISKHNQNIKAPLDVRCQMFDVRFMIFFPRDIFSLPDHLIFVAFVNNRFGGKRKLYQYAKPQ